MATQPKRHLLTRLLTLTLALGAPALLFAQTDKESALESRVQQLEAQLAELRALIVAQSAPSPAPAAVPGAPPPPPGS